jgi:murein DD-endopeptidase MepM/ murein hydrolase activator NlpD
MSARLGTRIANRGGVIGESGVDTVRGRMPATAQSAAVRAGLLRDGGPRPQSVNRSRQFSVLLVRGDGVRMLRFNFARPVAIGSFVTLALLVTVTGGFVGDYLKLRQITREAATYGDQIVAQRKTIDAVNERIASLRKEMGGWREMHVRIQEPFGPERAPSGRDKGIGGSTTRPETRPAPVSPSDELNRLTETVSEAGDSLRALDRLMARAGKALAALPSRWPVRGAVNSEFGNRHSPWTKVSEFHSGLDINAGPGTPVYAPAGGTVYFAGGQGEYGTAIIVDHGQDIRSLYGHLSKVAVRAGQKVERGAVIGYTGNTGRSSGPHLHYEVIVKGQAVNPRAYLWD